MRSNFRTLRDIEALLGAIHRDGGMLLFAVDGKTEEFALFECTCANHFRWDPSEGWIVGTYNKWIREQVEEILGLPELYTQLARLFEIKQFKSSEIADKAKEVEQLLSLDFAP